MKVGYDEGLVGSEVVCRRVWMIITRRMKEKEERRKVRWEM